MKLEQLMNGDIIVCRNGNIGVVIRNDGDEYILYQMSGYAPLYFFNDDLTYVAEYTVGDIMEVYRDATFDDVDDEESFPIWQRELGWRRPSEEERKVMEAQIEKERQERMNDMVEQENKRSNNLIFIVSQAFYGNRTATEILPEQVDRLILGYLDDKLAISEQIDRTVVRFPNAEGLVCIYNKYQEEKRQEEVKRVYEEENYRIKPLAVFPELGLTLYSRCIACRMDETGALQSLRDEDCDAIIKYFAK